ncbi:hypothetical protein CHL78_004735 [Romboutsia weinsteinii]|uniref:DUF3794 domain-containing protein n=1 Tax=Romboutsia weinsteinii TaxID=2020949 RepID=A0A371J763_9FIRM|nr:hypothetical protein [Romboutsia weinsteinii]RDY28496.1 hypothetical protein CHL78_004735 [Romboutsia weinsteinii]
MKVSLKKMICNTSCLEELSPLQYFSQFNVYQNIQLNNKNMNISNIENTIPKIQMHSTKIIDATMTETIEGTSLEGQCLSGRNLLLVGSLNASLILSYNTKNKKSKDPKKRDVVDVDIPFSTFIVIPQDIYDCNNINLRYLIEDTTVVKLTSNLVLVSVTMIVQYLDEH